MKRVAVFGNAGGGKSTLARQLAVITGLPLHVIDQLQFKEGGAAVPHDEYLKLHRDLLAQQDWIIDGYGDTTTVLERCSVADTLIHVDLRQCETQLLFYHQSTMQQWTSLPITIGGSQSV
jgi:adenylate kinase family enzyme